MCSITGSQNKIQVEAMLQKMKHRAPDDQGIKDDGKFVLGMGRLSIIDLKSKGLCPYTEDKFTLVFIMKSFHFI